MAENHQYTASGRQARAHIAELRKLRAPVLTERLPSTDEKLRQAIDTLESLAHLMYADLLAMRKRQNEHRTLVVEALQIAKALRGKQVDVEL